MELGLAAPVRRPIQYATPDRDPRHRFPPFAPSADRGRGRALASGTAALRAHGPPRRLPKILRESGPDPRWTQAQWPADKMFPSVRRVREDTLHETGSGCLAAFSRASISAAYL